MKHIVIDPQGTKHIINAPDDATPEQITAMAPQLIGQAQQAQTAPQEAGFVQRVGQDLKNRNDQANIIKEAYNSGQQGLVESALQGVGKVGAGLMNDVTGEAFKSVGNGISSITPDFIKEPVKDVASSVGNYVADSRAGNLARSAVQGYGEFEKNNPRAARNIDAATNIGLLGLSAKPIKSAGVASTAVAKQAADVGGAALSAGGKAVAAIPKAAVGTLAVTIPKADAQLASRAKDFGIDLRLDQISPTRARKSVQKISQDLPLSGVDTSEAANKIAFNKGVAKTIGQDAESLGPETITKFADDAKTKFGAAIGTGDFKVNAADFNQIANIENGLSKNVTNDIADIVKSHTKQFREDLTPTTETVSAGVDNFGQPITKKASTNPVISAEKLASLRSDLIQSLPKIDAKARPHVSDIVDIIDGIAARNISPERVDALKQARREWRNFKTIEPLLEKSTDGFINPTDLMQRVASSRFIKASKTATGEDDLVDLARIGKKFLVKSGGSDTISKGTLVGGGLSALTATGVGGPLAGLGTLAAQGVALGANRGYQALNKSKTIMDLSIKKSLK